ncbi:MAG: anthranilate phosphoribosyltransferase [Planctomycetes bacterium]|nr:anthranilate phosphoribosyltransferase [Planctomycetota bacterium]
MLREFFGRLVEGKDLSTDEAAAAMGEIMDGAATPAQIAAFATALRMKGETVPEIVGCARAMRQRVLRVAAPEGIVLDTCGTGGDGRGTFNFSTLAALVTAACGVAIAKHGNRAASSKCGSADLLEALGVRLELPKERLEACLREVGIVYLHAPALHPAMKHAAPVRKELGFRTLFNLLGPLTNPAFANVQTIGLFSPAYVRPFAEVLRELGTRAAFTFHGAGGLDEVSLLGPTRAARLARGRITSVTLEPRQAGFRRAKPSDIAGGTPQDNVDIARRVLSGQKGAHRDGVLLSAAIALVAAEKAAAPREGAELAARAIDTSAARTLLERWAAFTQVDLSRESLGTGDSRR